MARSRLPITFQIDGRSTAGETLCLEAGSSVLVLTSCASELGIDLRGAYVFGEGVGKILVAESTVIDAGPAELKTRYIDGPAGTMTYYRRRLLYDHLQALQDLALGCGLKLAFDDIEEAAVAVDPHLSDH